jgi:hypothetical protein
MRSSGSGAAGSLLCEEPKSGTAASQNTSTITAGGKRRLGISGVHAAITYTLASSVEDIRQAALKAAAEKLGSGRNRLEKCLYEGHGFSCPYKNRIDKGFRRFVTLFEGYGLQPVR